MDTLSREGCALRARLPGHLPSERAGIRPTCGGDGPASIPTAFRVPSPLSHDAGFLPRILTPQVRCPSPPASAPAPTAASRLLLLSGRPRAPPRERARYQEEGVRGEGERRVQGVQRRGIRPPLPSEAVLCLSLWNFTSISSFTSGHPQTAVTIPTSLRRELRHREFKPLAQSHATQRGGREFSDASRRDSEASVLKNHVAVRASSAALQTELSSTLQRPGGTKPWPSLRSEEGKTE